MPFRAMGVWRRLKFMPSSTSYPTDPSYSFLYARPLPSTDTSCGALRKFVAGRC